MSSVAEVPEVKDYNQFITSQHLQAISAKQAEKAPFTMPEVAIGDDVVWYRDANRSNRPGLGKVLAVYERTIDIILMDMSTGVGPKSASRHINDPRLLNQTVRQDSGGWDYAKSTLDRIAMEKRVATLEAFVADLQGTKPKGEKKAS